MIETIKSVKFLPFILFIGAVLACSAPFVHMIYPNKTNTELSLVKKQYKEGKLSRGEYIQKKKEVTYFGYQNKRKLWYSIGKPISMLYFSLLLMYSSFYVTEKQFKISFKFGAITGVLVSFYFIIWAFWYRADFPESLYYIAIGVVSALSTAVSYFSIQARNNIIKKIKLLTNHIVVKGKRHVSTEHRKDYINDYLETFNKVID
ncbi:conserved membrane hypothetical protein [Tenacibaculum sp. 190524A02b]|uniref:Uncharacterized protein n=1 Tax=Tenacibaculum vairaonense TaxID=3137860 RepID=A0ABP1FFU0_9FLAO